MLGGAKKKFHNPQNNLSPGQEWFSTTWICSSSANHFTMMFGDWKIKHVDKEIWLCQYYEAGRYSRNALDLNIGGNWFESLLTVLSRWILE